MLTIWMVIFVGAPPPAPVGRVASVGQPNGGALLTTANGGTLQPSRNGGTLIEE